MSRIRAPLDTIFLHMKQEGGDCPWDFRWILCIIARIILSEMVGTRTEEKKGLVIIGDHYPRSRSVDWTHEVTL